MRFAILAAVFSWIIGAHTLKKKLHTKGIKEVETGKQKPSQYCVWNFTKFDTFKLRGLYSCVYKLATLSVSQKKSRGTSHNGAEEMSQLMAHPSKKQKWLYLKRFKPLNLNHWTIWVLIFGTQAAPRYLGNDYVLFVGLSNSLPACNLGLLKRGCAMVLKQQLETTKHFIIKLFLADFANKGQEDARL